MGTQEWSKRLVTRSGCLFDVRPAHVGDEAAISELFEHISPEDRAFRALTGHGGAVQITHSDHHPSKTFLACLDDDDELIAAVMLDCDTDPHHGDVNLVIRPEYKHDGVSWELLAHVLRYATAIGVTGLTSVEARTNLAAIAIETEMGFTARDHPGNAALVLMRKTLGAA